MACVNTLKKVTIAQAIASPTQTVTVYAMNLKSKDVKTPLHATTIQKLQTLTTHVCMLILDTIAMAIVSMMLTWMVFVMNLKLTDAWTSWPAIMRLLRRTMMARVNILTNFTTAMATA